MESTGMTPTAPPVLDFSPFYGGDNDAKVHLVEQIRNCCLYNGFFQVTGHRVPRELQLLVMNCAKRFFDLPLEEKTKIDKGWSLHRPKLTDTDRDRSHLVPPRLRTPRVPDSRTWHPSREERRSLHRRGDLRRSSLLREQEAQQWTQPVAGDCAKSRGIQTHLDGILPCGV